MTCRKEGDVTDAAIDLAPELAYDRAYLLQLLTEVRPDSPLDDFRHYVCVGDFREDLFAALLAEALNAGEAAIYPDEVNAPIVCLTPLGAQRAGVHLSQSHPPIWLRDDGEDPPMFAAADGGFILFTDLDAENFETGEFRDFIADQADPDAVEPVEVLTNVEEFSEWLLVERSLPDGRLIPKRAEFCLIGADRSWPRGHAHGADPAPPGTPTGSTWQELFTRCPYCRVLPEGETCKVCLGRAPGRRCPDCDGRVMGFTDLCLWCNRSGIDHLLPRVEVVQARRRPGSRTAKIKRKRNKT
jgi:hypothetical protein